VKLKAPWLVITAAIALMSAAPSWAEEVAVEKAKPPDLPAPPPQAEEVPEPAFTFGADLDFNSRYMWRGLRMSEGAVMQPSLWASHKGFTFSLWSNIDLEDEPGRPNFNELDYTLSYWKEWMGFTWEPNVAHYTYPNTGWPSTTELGLKVSRPVGPVTLFTSHWIDVQEVAGAYYGELGLEYERELAPKWTLQASGIFGWGSSRFNQAYIGPNETAANAFSVSLALTRSLGGGVYVRPHIQYSRLLDGALRGAVKDPDNFVVGVNVGVEF
jgi:hypothetical protein